MVHAYKIKALLQKDAKDLTKNSSAVLLACIGVLFTALYSVMDFGGEGFPPEMLLAFGAGMNVSMFPVAAMSMLIAEEKEKHTLRTLMLSNVSAQEFLLSKAVLLLAISQVVNIICFFIAGAQSSFLLYFGVTALTTVCVLLFGALVGLLSKNQMSTGVASTPFALILLMPAIFGRIDEGIAKFAQFTPVYAMLELFQPTGRALFFVAVLLVWIVFAAVSFSIVYRKKRLDI